jgi:hypothetical protein
VTVRRSSREETAARPPYFSILSLYTPSRSTEVIFRSAAHTWTRGVMRRRVMNADLRMRGAGHVGPVDLDDLVAWLEPAVRGDEPVREDLLHHNTAKRGVGPAHNGDPQGGAGGQWGEGEG